MRKKHHLHSWPHRTLYAGLLVFFVMSLGTVGMHLFEGMSWMDAFYFTSMIATAQGSATTPFTFEGKLFASLLSFFSVGVVITAISFLVGPLLGKLFKVGFEKYEDDLDH